MILSHNTYSGVKRDELVFEYLPAFASFLLKEKLSEFVISGLEFSRQEDLPVLKYLIAYSEPQLIEMGKIGNSELLTALAENKVRQYIDKSLKMWMENRLVIIDRDEIAAEDITVGAFVRRKLFRSFLMEYAKEEQLFIKLMEEVDRFTTQNELLSFNAFILLQREKLGLVNTELRDANTSLSEKNTELQRMNDELESFTYVASHDLQEPLRKIQTYSGRLTEHIATLPKTAAEYIEKINGSSLRMQNLIEDLLEFSQLTSPADAFEDANLDEVLEEAKRPLSEIIEQNNAVIESDHLPRVNVIPFQFSQLFTNILGNALKYRKVDQYPHIKVSSEIGTATDPGTNREGKYIKITIQDNGIGFDPEYAEKIFDLFKRLHAKEKYTGTGIGLSICKKIVHNHNGFILAESEKGRGSSFHIYLPEERIVRP